VNPIFFKELPLVVSIQGKPEFIGFAAGFSKEVDPLSGMTFNLKDIMDWQQQWKAQSIGQSFALWTHYLQNAFSHFRKLAPNAKELIVQVRFWDQSTLRMTGSHFRYTRIFPQSDSMGRLRILQLECSVQNESELERIRHLHLQDELPGSFDEPELLYSYFESKLGLSDFAIEIKDPETQISISI
jgi:hypothetical protein